MSDTKALEILEKEDGTYLSIQGKRYSAMILLGHSEMAHNAILELAAELAELTSEAKWANYYFEQVEKLTHENAQLRAQLAAAQADLESAKEVIKELLVEIGVPPTDKYSYDSRWENAYKHARDWLSVHPETKDEK